MAKVEVGSITINSTGNKLAILDDPDFIIDRIVFTISDSTTAWGNGYYDANEEFSGSLPYAEYSNTKSILHYRNVSGVKTKVVEGTVTDISEIGEFSINISTFNSSGSIILGFTVYGN